MSEKQRRRKFVFMGSDPIALPLLDSLWSQKDLEWVGVFTQPDRPHGRGKKITPNSVKVWATERGISVLQPDKPSDETVEWLKDQGVELILVVAYGHLLRKSLREVPQLGIFNMHASLLPKYRGASPIETAIALGDSRTGVSLMEMVARMDAGPVVDIEEVAIDCGETGPSLREKIGEAMVPLWQKNHEAILAGSVESNPQDENQANYVRLLKKEDGMLDFSLSSEEIECRIRAFKGWPGAYFETSEGERIRVGLAEIGANRVDESEPGLVLDSESALSVQTGNGALRVLELQRPGGKMLKWEDFSRGFQIQKGTKLLGGQAKPLVSKEPF